MFSNLNKIYKFFSLYFIIFTLSFQIINAAEKSCFSCDGINCQRTTKLNHTENCNDPMDICVTIFKDFTIESKGCLSRMPDKLRSKCDDLNNFECDKCQENLCNKYGRKDFICIECDSSKNKDCANKTENIEPIRCEAPSAINSYCYIDSANGNVKRGCATQTKQQNDCFKKQDTCKLCLPGDNEVCNGPRILKPIYVKSGGVEKSKFITILGISSVLLTLKL